MKKEILKAQEDKNNNTFDNSEESNPKRIPDGFIRNYSATVNQHNNTSNITQEIAQQFNTLSKELTNTINDTI
jgi:hypothetical protein